MADQLHKRFNNEQVKELLTKYHNGEIKSSYLMNILGVKRSRFFKLASVYKKDPDTFTIQYSRNTPNRRIGSGVEKNMLKILKAEKKMIENPDVPIRRYNYSYVRDYLKEEFKQEVSVPTIISRAKEHDYYLPRKKRKNHNREILTNYIGELVQHDSSFHKWAPHSEEKWYLITSLDDYSRMLLHAELLKQDTSWNHILAAESVFMTYGIPYRYYVDSHSIFRFVQGRDSNWRNHKKFTDMVVPQWKQVLNDCGVEITHSLSPQAHGKIERPYGWLQDRIVRTCYRKGIKNIEPCRDILRKEVERYNYRQVHSTTGEIPWIRFKRAVATKQNLFREFHVRPPYTSTKDIFCLRDEKVVDQYSEISFRNITFKMPVSSIGDKVKMRIAPNAETGVASVRFWYQGNLIEEKSVKNEDLHLVQF